MSDKLTLLKQYWGYDSFRPQQEAIIDSVLQGHDTLALLPTGGGKSLCYQLPALMKSGICIVVSPLIALMKDQVQQLNDRHIKAACLVSGLKQSSVDAVISSCQAGSLKLLYISPERLQQRSFIENIRHAQVSLIAVDEAHCISQWGYDFRPPYLEIANLRDWFPQASVIALTATATPPVLEDIATRLKMRQCKLFRSSFLRENLAYMVINESNKMPRLLRILNRTGGSAIVYVRRRRRTDEIARWLSNHDIPSLSYHGGLDARERDHRQHLWMSGDCHVMVATNAFGMGIDKPDVRCVVHLDIPDSLEAYFQEAGRAGRDGEKAYAVLLYDQTDLNTLRTDHESSFPTLRLIRNVYRALCNYYKIPLGSGTDLSFDFKLEQVCDTYQMPVREFYSACQFLQREGLIDLPEYEETSSKLYIPLSRNELYRFRVDHLQMGNLLEVILRTYSGLTTSPVRIDEHKIATRFYATTAEVKNLLSQMHAMHIVEYQPKSDCQQIIFTSPRINEQDLYISEKNYKQLKEASQERLDAVLAYLSNNDECRTRQMMAYFGEDNDKDCGCCDVCISRHKNATQTVEAAIIVQLRRQPMRIRELCEWLDSEGYIDAEKTVRDMIDSGNLSLDANLFLKLT